MAHTMKSNKLDFDNLDWKTNYTAWDAYAASKLANVYFTKELAKRLSAESVTHVKVVSLHPGVVRTELARNMANCCFYCVSILMAPIMYMMTLSPWYGA